jgi:predicted Zn-dependent protease
MRASFFTRASALFVSGAFLLQCASTSLRPISSYGAAFEPEDDERALWRETWGEESKLRAEMEIYQDPALVEYLEEVLGKLTPPAMAANPSIQYRVTIIEEPTLNAFVFPTGSMYVHTGLLARLENEAQLATILGHELTHVDGRHMLRFQRDAKNKVVGLTAAAVIAAVVIGVEQAEAAEKDDWKKVFVLDVVHALVELGLTFAFIAAVNGYGRDLETEADLLGLERMRAASYDVSEAPKVYRELLEDHGEDNALETFFFGSHPKLTTRIENVEKWLQDNPPGPESVFTPASNERFDARIRWVVRDDARENIELGRLSLAEDQLERAQSMLDEDSELSTIWGLLWLKRSRPTQDAEERQMLQDRAEQAFRDAIRLDAENPEPRLALGLLAYGRSDFEIACAQLTRYLELTPTGTERDRVRDYVEQMQREGHCTGAPPTSTAGVRASLPR